MLFWSHPLAAVRRAQMAKQNHVISIERAQRACAEYALARVRRSLRGHKLWRAFMYGPNSAGEMTIVVEAGHMGRPNYDERGRLRWIKHEVRGVLLITKNADCVATPQGRASIEHLETMISVFCSGFAENPPNYHGRPDLRQVA